MRNGIKPCFKSRNFRSEYARVISRYESNREIALFRKQLAGSATVGVAFLLLWFRWVLYLKSLVSGWRSESTCNDILQDQEIAFSRPEGKHYTSMQVPPILAPHPATYCRRYCRQLFLPSPCCDALLPSNINYLHKAAHRSRGRKVLHFLDKVFSGGYVWGATFRAPSSAARIMNV